MRSIRTGRTTHRVAVPVVVFATLALTGCTPQMPRPCTIEPAAAAVSIVRRDSPVARLHGWPTEMLAVGNHDAVDWQRVEVAIAGVTTTRARGRPPTGQHTSPEQKSVPRGGLAAFTLGAFENSRGGRWMPAAMHATTAELTFVREGERCRATVAVVGPTG